MRCEKYFWTFVSYVCKVNGFVVIKFLWEKRILGMDLHCCCCFLELVSFELTPCIILLKVICAPLPGHRPWYPYVLYTVSWSLDFIISITVPAGFVLEISWMDIEWQSKLYLITNWQFWVSVCQVHCTNFFCDFVIFWKSAGVRKASVSALQNLYEVDDNVPSLGLFTERFYKRMLELADDIDISVAVCAIGLVKQLLRYLQVICLFFLFLLNFGFIMKQMSVVLSQWSYSFLMLGRHQLVPDEELGPLYDLLIDDPPEIRRAIGALVYDHLIAQKFQISQSTGNFCLILYIP